MEEARSFMIVSGKC